MGQAIYRGKMKLIHDYHQSKVVDLFVFEKVYLSLPLPLYLVVF